MVRLLSRRDGLLLGAGGFSPRQLPGLALWLDASRSGSVLTGGASQFTAASSQYLSIADNAALSTGDVDFWVTGWAYLDNSGSARTLASKFKFGGSNDREWCVDLSGAGGARLLVSGDGITAATLTHSVSISATTWYFVIACHDSVNNTISISVNGSAFESQAHSVGSFDGIGQFNIGARDNGTGNYMDGRIANVCFGKSPPLGIAALAATIRDTLYNGGNGVDLRTISAATRTAWGGVSAWPLDEVTGTRADVWASNVLTNNNSVSHQNGPFTYNAVDGIVDREWTGLAPSTAIATASALGVTAPIHKTGIKNGLPIERYDGTDDLFTLTSALVLSGDFTYCALVKVGAVPGAYFGHSSGTGYISQSDTTHLDVNNDAGTNLSMAHAALDTNFHVLTLVRSGSTVSRYLDGTLDGTGTLAGTITLNQIGRHGAATAPLNGDEGEQVLTTTALSGGTLSQLARYLGRRWAVAVAA